MRQLDTLQYHWKWQFEELTEDRNFIAAFQAERVDSIVLWALLADTEAVTAEDISHLNVAGDGLL